jgi:peptidoglycan/xylan/chitin deacetylase (PgdA/CDA1 family)
VLLTYDDWDYDSPETIATTARYARAHDVGLLYFPLGQSNREYAQAHGGRNLAQAVRRQGQYVGNHTYSHPDLTTLTDRQIRSQLERGIRSSLLRPPFGSSDDNIRTIAERMGLGLCTWTLDTLDWTGKTGPQVCAFVKANTAVGDIVLMHLNAAAHNRRTLGCIIRGLQAEGFELCRPWRDAEGTVTTSPARLPYILPC